MSVLAILLILANFTVWFIHNKAIKNLLLSVQGQLADKGLSLSYDEVIFDTLAAWHMSGYVKNVEIYATNTQATNVNSLYINIGNVEIDSNWLEHQFTALLPSEITLLIKYFTTPKSEEVIPLKFVSPKPMKIGAHIDFSLSKNESNSHLKLWSIHTALPELLIQKEKEPMLLLKELDCNFTKNPIKNHSIEPDNKLVNLQPRKLEKIVADYNEWLLDISLNHIEFTPLAKEQLARYSSYISKMGTASFYTKIGRIANIDKNGDNEYLNLGYRINNFTVNSDFFSVIAYGDYFGRVDEQDKISNYIDMFCNITNYENMIDFYTDLMNKFISLYNTGEPFPQKDIKAIKRVISKIWKVDHNYLKLRFVQDGGQDVLISGYTKDQILEMASKESANH